MGHLSGLEMTVSNKPLLTMVAGADVVTTVGTVSFLLGAKSKLQALNLEKTCEYER